MTEPRSGWLNGKFGYWRPNGEFMPIIAGAQDDEKNDEKDDDKEDDDETDADDDDDTKDIKDPAGKLKAEIEKKNRFDRQLKETRVELKKAQDELKKQEDAKKSDQEKAEERAIAAEKKVTELEAKVVNQTKRTLLVENEDIAKLSAGRRRSVIRLIDLDDIEVDDDGDNVEDIINALKEEDPGLFDEGDSSEEEEEEEEERKTRSKKTAPPPRKKRDKNAPDKTGLERRMPHLAKHRPMG